MGICEGVRRTWVFVEVSRKLVFVEVIENLKTF